MTDLTRRQFAALTAATVAAPLTLVRSPYAAPAVSAGDVVERIRKGIGVDWKAETVDTLKAGDAATAVTGVVTTALASMAILRQAVDAGANMIVTCEPTFYARSDARTPPAGRGGRGGAGAAAPDPPPPPPPADPIYTAKNAYIDKHKLVIFRLSEHWKLRRPEPFAAGLAAALGWTKLLAAGDASRYAISAASLERVAADVKKRLGSRGGIRVVGDPKTEVRSAGLLPGSTPIAAALDLLPGVDLVVAGEVREWESVEYARDVVFSGQRKGLILVGRIVSEEGGMNACASWLSSIVPEVRVRHLPAGDPYWRPA